MSSDDALIAELERQREFARQCFEHYARQEELGVFLERPKPDISEITSPVNAVLTTHPVFGPGRNIFFATKQLNLHPHYVSQGLLRMVLNSDAQSAVTWLHRLFEIDRADLRLVAVLYGLEADQPVTLANNVRLLPFADTPDSPNFRMLARRYQINPWSMLDIDSILPPTMAVLNMGTVAASADLMTGHATYDRAYGAILDAARGFTLADRAAPVIGASWMDFIDPTLTSVEFGRIWMSARYEGSLSQAPRLKVDADAIAWAERYLRLSESLRGSVDVALDRLNLARRRRSSGNQAIDICICLEALMGDDSSQELTYKLRLRAALLLGTTYNERLEISEAVRKLYDLRSKVVHGRARLPKHTLPDTQCASRGLEICTQAVRAIVRRNTRPDFAEWELTGGPVDSKAPDA
ncbi:MAG: hypothetical protein ACLQIQ_06240 [Beijerinckiaceae bacterium]